MNFRYGKIRLSLFTLAVIYALGLLFYRCDLLKFSSYFLWDRLALSARLPGSPQAAVAKPDLPAVIISIDEESHDKLGLRWPWERDTIAKLVDQIAARKPRAVIFDLFFSGPSPVRHYDEQLAQALLRNPCRSVLGILYDRSGRLYRPYGQIAESVRGFGFANLPESVDGKIRAFHAVAKDPEGNGYVPVLGVAAAMAWLGIDSAPRAGLPEKQGLITYYPVRFESEKGARILKTVDSLHAMGIVPPVPPDEIPRVPLWKAVRGSPELEIIRDKLVFIGFEGSVFKDDFKTPWGYVSGVSIHALIALMILSGQSVLAAPAWLSAAVFLALTAFLCLLLPNVNRWTGLLSAAGLAAACLAACVFLFLKKQVFFDISLPVAGISFFTLFSILREDTASLLKVAVLKNQLSHDPMTKLYNAKYFELSVDSALRKTRRGDDLLSLVILDIDFFKSINDRFGHQEGNKVIKIFADALRRTARREDVPARFGGDEFCSLLPLTDRAGTQKYLERLREDVLRGLQKKKVGHEVSFSAGAVVLRGRKIRTYKEFLEKADRALYDAKNAGRNQFRIIEA